MSSWTFTDNSDQAKRAMDNAIYKALYEAGAKAEAAARKRLKENDSVKSGNLQKSIASRMNTGGKAVYIGSPLEYGPYVEFGTKRQKKRNPKPWLFPALKNGRSSYRSIIRKTIKSIMESSGL